MGDGGGLGGPCSKGAGGPCTTVASAATNFSIAQAGCRHNTQSASSVLANTISQTRRPRHAQFGRVIRVALELWLLLSQKWRGRVRRCLLHSGDCFGAAHVPRIFGSRWRWRHRTPVYLSSAVLWSRHCRLCFAIIESAQPRKYWGTLGQKQLWPNMGDVGQSALVSTSCRPVPARYGLKSSQAMDQLRRDPCKVGGSWTILINCFWRQDSVSAN